MSITIDDIRKAISYRIRVKRSVENAFTEMGNDDMAARYFHEQMALEELLLALESESDFKAYSGEL